MGKLSSEIITHQTAYRTLSEATVDKIRINNAGIQGYKLSATNDNIKEVLEKLKMSNLLKFRPIMNYKFIDVILLSFFELTNYGS